MMYNEKGEILKKGSGSRSGQKSSKEDSSQEDTRGRNESRVDAGRLGWDQPDGKADTHTNRTFGAQVEEA